MFPKFSNKMVVLCLCLLTGVLAINFGFHTPKTALAADSAAPAYTKTARDAGPFHVR